MGLIYFMGNKTIVGGFLGGLIGVEITKKKIGVTTSSGDLMVYPLIVAMDHRSHWMLSGRFGGWHLWHRVKFALGY